MVEWGIKVKRHREKAVVEGIPNYLERQFGDRYVWLKVKQKGRDFFLYSNVIKGMRYSGLQGSV